MDSSIEFKLLKNCHKLYHNDKISIHLIHNLKLCSSILHHLKLPSKNRKTQVMGCIHSALSTIFPLDSVLCMHACLMYKSYLIIYHSVKVMIVIYELIYSMLVPHVLNKFWACRYFHFIQKMPTCQWDKKPDLPRFESLCWEVQAANRACNGTPESKSQFKQKTFSLRHLRAGKKIRGISKPAKKGDLWGYLS